MITLMGAEMHAALKDFRRAAGDWRRVARVLGPVAAAGGLAAGGLVARKWRSPPDDDLLGRRASFACAPRAAGSAQALERELRRAGLSEAEVAALRRAARRLRGPAERDLAAAECSLAEGGSEAGAAPYRGLVEDWRRRGLLDEPATRPRPAAAFQGFDCVTRVDESYGRDVGCEVPLCLLRGVADGPCSTLCAGQWVEAADALDAHGVVRLRSLLSDDQVLALRERLRMQTSALDRARAASGAAAAAPLRDYDTSPLEDEDPELVPVQSTPGRRHLYLRGRALEEVVRDAQAGALPLVWEHLGRALPEGRALYVSEVQLLVVDPCAIDQFWHTDNTAPGLTLFVPLTPVSKSIGPTMFVPGSHHLLAQDKGRIGRWSSFLASFLSTTGDVVGTVEPGDALLYDSRTLHRCAANRCYDRVRVALVFRYDFEQPPGQGLAGAQATSWLGNALAAFGRFYASLPGPSAPAPAAGSSDGD